jgi:ribose transport system permease protein
MASPPDAEAAAAPRPPTSLRERALEGLDALGGAWIVVILVGLIAVFTVLTDGTFFTAENFKNLALDTSEILILAAGMTFIILAAGLDLSVGSVVVFASVVAAKLMADVGGEMQPNGLVTYPNLALGLTVGIGAALLAGAGWGLVNGFVGVRLRVPPFIVTLGTLGMALGFAQVITGGLNVSNVPPQLQEFFGLGEMFGLIPWPVVTAAVIVGVLWMVLAKTRFGLHTYAVGSNLEGARRAGISVDRHVISLYVLMGALAGVVGVIDVARFNTASIAAHTQDNLAAIAAVVIGGTSLFGGSGRMLGTVIGAFIPSILRNGFILLDVQPFWQNVAVGGVLIVAVYLDQLRRKEAA